MSSCNKDLYDYDLVKKCCRRGLVKVKTDFCFQNDTHKYKNECIQCMSSRHKEGYYKNYEKFKEKQKDWIKIILKN